MVAEQRRKGPSIEAVPDGDTKARLVCPDCGYVAYQNPKIVVGAVCVWEDTFLLCRRAIAPRKGLWTMPAGFLELNESTAEGAKREALEEANARIEIEGLIGVYEIPHVSMLYVIHRARLLSPEVSAGAESEAVAFFRWSDIPWDALAFSSVAWAHRQFQAAAAPTLAIAPPGF